MSKETSNNHGGPPPAAAAASPKENMEAMSRRFKSAKAAAASNGSGRQYRSSQFYPTTAVPGLGFIHAISQKDDGEGNKIYTEVGAWIDASKAVDILERDRRMEERSKFSDKFIKTCIRVMELYPNLSPESAIELAEKMFIKSEKLYSNRRDQARMDAQKELDEERMPGSTTSDPVLDVVEEGATTANAHAD